MTRSGLSLHRFIELWPAFVYVRRTSRQKSFRFLSQPAPTHTEELFPPVRELFGDTLLKRPHEQTHCCEIFGECFRKLAPRVAGRLDRFLFLLRCFICFLLRHNLGGQGRNQILREEVAEGEIGLFLWPTYLSETRRPMERLTAIQRKRKPNNATSKTRWKAGKR